jgi:protein-S-isoprenylcysteine O-methyltransferase Ste14
MRFLWRNFPIPEPFIIALLAGGLLQVIIPASLLPSSAAGLMAGSLMACVGVATIAWGILAAGGNDLDKQTALVTTGPYAFSRNPMYLAWVALGIGLSLVFNSLWLVIATCGAAVYIHFITIPGEEKALRNRFGDQYEAYRQHVRRWL